MTAIAGHISLGGDLRPAEACARMIAAQAIFGPHDQSIRSVDRAAFGRSLFKTLSEDAFDRQPLEGGDGRYMLVADVRIDNRRELSDQLGIGHRTLHGLSDADLLLAAWETWNEGALDRVLGDFAFAVWDANRQQLSLGRSALGMKPLFYHTGNDFIAFASTPAALHALVPKSLDLGRAAAFAVGGAPRGPETIFRMISRVEQGTIVRFKGNSAHASRFWDIPRRRLNLAKPGDYAEAFREQLDRAVTAQLRRADGAVACHLSSGRDSSAVAGTAARLLAANQERVLAYTSAPRADYPGPTIANMLADESILAAATARMHSNMDHRICRPDGRLDFADLEQVHLLNSNPVGHLSNFAWWNQINGAASCDGASIILTGQVGNFGLSAGGEAHLPDLLREGGLVQWWQAARGLAGASPAGWRSALNRSLGPFLPRALYALLLRAVGRGSGSVFDAPMLRPPFREMAESGLASEFSEIRPPRDFFEYRREMLFQQDNASKMSLARFGIDTRDPTADRRLVEFCFSLPIEALVSARQSRPLFNSALADRVAPQVLSSRLRGYQGADWHETITRSEVADRFHRYRRHDLVSELIDVEYVQGIIDHWPRGGWDDRRLMSLYRNDLLGIVSLANFIVVNF